MIRPAWWSRAAVASLLAASGWSSPAHSSSGCLRALVGGDEHTLVLLPDGTVWAWGSNDKGQLGDGTTVDSPVPLAVPGLPTIASIGEDTEGEHHSIALATDGHVWTWGDNSFGQIGNGTRSLLPVLVPAEVAGLDSVVALASAEYHNIVLRADGTLRAWGNNDYGQLGDGTNTTATSPVVSRLDRVVKVMSGDLHALAIRDDGTLASWGNGSQGQLGSGAFTDSNVPLAVDSSTGLSKAIDVSGGALYSLAIDPSGAVWVWGANDHGQLGNGTTSIQGVALPGLVLGLPGPAQAICAGESFALALLVDGSVWAWGEGGYGQLGQGNWLESHVPVAVLGISDVAEISCGDNHALAVGRDGRSWGWGANYHGQLGNPAAGLRSNLPVQIGIGLPDPIPPDQGNILRAVKRLPDVLLDFTGAPATTWRVYRDASKLMLGTTALTPDALVTTFTDPGIVPTAPPLDFYRLKGLSPCSLTPGP